MTPAETLLDTLAKSDDRRAALCYVHEAFAEAILAGIGTESFAEAAITAALHELVACYGEDSVARFVVELSERVRRSEFTVTSKH